MIEKLLLPEDLLQLEKLDVEVDLCEDTSFLAIIGMDTKELSLSFNQYFNEIDNITTFIPKTNNILAEVTELEDKENFIYIDLFEIEDIIYIKNLLFFRDFISDYNLKIFLMVNDKDYKNILKTAIDLYNIATFSYVFTTYKIDIHKKIDKKDLIKLLAEYKDRKNTLSRKQKISFLFQIGSKYSKYGDINLSLKFFNDAKSLAEKMKNEEVLIEIKYTMADLYRHSDKFKITEKYQLESMEFFKRKKNIVGYKDTLESLSVLYCQMGLFDKSLLFTKKMYDLAIEHKDKDYKISALSRYTLTYNAKKDLKKMNEYWDKTYLLASKENDEHTLSALYQSKAVQLINRLETREALVYLNKAVDYYKKNNDILMLTAIYNKISYAYYLLYDYNKSFIYSKWCYKYFKLNSMDSELLQTLRYMSFNYFSLNKFDDSINKTLEALKISRKLSLSDITFDLLIYINQIYISKKSYTEGIKYLNEAEKLAKKMNSDKFETLYFRYADTYKEMSIIDKAYKYYEKAIDLNIENSVNVENYKMELLAEIYFKDNKLKDSLQLFQDALRLSRKDNDLLRVISIEKNLGFLYKKMNNVKLSKKYFMEVISKLKILNKDDVNIKDLEIEVEILKNSD